MNAFSAYINVAQEFFRWSHDHAGANEGIGDLITAAISIVIVAVSLFLCVKYFLFPKENKDTHIKKRILDDEVRGERGLHHE